MNQPLLNVDFPDVDIIRVEDTYYMLGTSMYFMPGCEIIRSTDLVHWEHATYVYDRLDSTPAQRLEEGNIYSAGMWAASFRYHNGTYYICFVANDTHKTYLFTTKDLYGTWEKKEIEGFYHDSSLLFDDDGKVYIAYGNREIYVTELKEDLSGPKPGGFHKMVVKDEWKNTLGFEGTHFYKINGTYYLFFIHSLPGRWYRTEACFFSDSLNGEFTGGDVFADDNGYRNAGIAQGAIIDTPDGDWYAILFQDRGGSGRIPYLIPMHWDGKQPVIGNNGRLTTEELSAYGKRDFKQLVGSDDFKVIFSKDSCFGFHRQWQFNHEPTMELITRNLKDGTYSVTSDKLCTDPTQAKNSLTQRMCEPSCEAEITVYGEKLKKGDYVGLTALQYLYGFIGMRAEESGYSIVFMEKPDKGEEDKVTVLKTMTGSVAKFKIHAEFAGVSDQATFFYDAGDGYKEVPVTKNLPFLLEHFTGYRFAITYFATEETGGTATFGEFNYTYDGCA
ncbi:MAG: family 43 glycosylhydrolase [Lachnospiraceae bacterium]